ncbi:MAG: hypothetical protein HKP10_06850 [Kiritimatiellales bacterium]|nr:hypothetical protein [Kiritimatiellales bacterium]
MAKTYTSLLIALLLPLLHCFAQDTGAIDAMIQPLEEAYSIRIHYAFDPAAYFPEEWAAPSIAATGRQADLVEVQRIIPIIQAFLANHPATVVQNNLEHIYLLGELVCGGREYGSTHTDKSIYLPCKTVEEGYTSAFLEQRLHSEFSSLLFNLHTFPAAPWLAVNPAGFRYSGTGFEMLRDPLRFDATESYRTDGFLLKYSRSSLENDFNMISAWMFTQPGLLDWVCQQYPRIQQKKTIAENFYRSISSEYAFP